MHYEADKREHAEVTRSQVTHLRAFVEFSVARSVEELAPCDLWRMSPRGGETRPSVSQAKLLSFNEECFTSQILVHDSLTLAERPQSKLFGTMARTKGQASQCSMLES